MYLFINLTLRYYCKYNNTRQTNSSANILNFEQHLNFLFFFY